jgi:integrase
MVSTIGAPGRYADGDGLYLVVDTGGAKRWQFHYRWSGKRREMGLGSLTSTSLAEARDKAGDARKQVAAGIDPIEERDRAAKAREAEAAKQKTFGQFCDDILPSILAHSRNAKHQWQWETTLKGFAGSLRDKPLADIGRDDVLAVLQQQVVVRGSDGKEKRGSLWLLKAETASRLRGRIERILDAAKVKGFREGENPARWRGHLDMLLQKRQKLTRGHHAAMPYAEVPAFLPRLREVKGVGAAALEFTILTAARSGEAIGARWSEFDLDAGIWVVPAERMKAGVEHRVPLVPVVVKMLRELHKTRRSEFVFAGIRAKSSISNMTMMKALRAAGGEAYTVHGFRSSFRDWAGEETHFPREVAEEALAHIVGSEVERAYRRGDALEKRRKLMLAWANYVLAAPTGNVIPMKRKAAAE